jgi:hypothetical protein
LSSQAAGAYGFAPIILKSGNTALTVDHTNGISTTNTLTLRDVNVTGTASGQDATALTNFVTLAQLNTKQPASTVVSNLAAASPAVGFLTNNGASGVGWLPGSILLDFATNNYTSTSNLLVTMTNAGTAIIFLTNSISNVTFTNAGKQDVIFIAQTDSTIFFNTNNHFASTNGFTIVASKYSTAITNGQHGYLSVTRFLDSQAGCAIGYKLEEGR